MTHPQTPWHFQGQPLSSKSGCCCWSDTKLCLTPSNPIDCSILGFPVLHYLLEFSQTHIRWVSDAVQPSHPLSSTSCLALNPSCHQDLFQWVGSLHRQNIGASAFSITPSNEYLGLISFRIDWFDLLAVQGILKTTIWKHQFFASQLSLLSNT